ncbi:MAG: hypothetical protein ACO37D_02375, partial [Rhodothermales bacterium]
MTPPLGAIAPLSDHGLESDTTVPTVSLRGLILPLALGLGVLAIIAWYTWDEGGFSRFAEAVNPWIMAAAVGMTGAR